MTVEERFAADEKPTQEEWREWFGRVLAQPTLSPLHRKLLTEREAEGVEE